MTAAESAERAQQYDPREIQEKWQDRWAGMDLFRASDDPGDPRPRTYLLDMFPYPSGDLHMGHAEAYAIADAVARYYFQRHHNVLHPIGWDAFGLPAENAAIRNNTHPADWTYANIETQAASFRRYAVSFDWSRRLQTCDPAYYRWNQWLFLRFYERGLAYRKDGHVNWCPHDQTVLANEQVIAGRCERCGTEVVRRVLTQWYFKITARARLTTCFPPILLLEPLQFASPEAPALTPEPCSLPISLPRSLPRIALAPGLPPHRWFGSLTAFRLSTPHPSCSGQTEHPLRLLPSS